MCSVYGVCVCVCLYVVCMCCMCVYVLCVCHAEHEIRTEKCSDTCQHKIKFVLTFSKKRSDISRNMCCSIIL